MHLENTKTKHVRRFLFLRGEMEVFQRKQESYMRKWHSKEDRKGLEQIYVSFHKMCSSLDPLVYSEMWGKQHSRKELLWHSLWWVWVAGDVTALSLTVTAAALCPLRWKERNFAKRFHSPCKCESSSLHNKLAVPASTNWNGKVCRKKTLQI